MTLQWRSARGARFKLCETNWEPTMRLFKQFKHGVLAAAAMAGTLIVAVTGEAATLTRITIAGNAQVEGGGHGVRPRVYTQRLPRSESWCWRLRIHGRYLHCRQEYIRSS